MTKEEFLKKAMGAQYSEREEGLLDMATAKRNLGAQFTEGEFKEMVGSGEVNGLMDVTGEGSETHTMPDGTVMQGATHMGNMKNARGAQYSERETDAFGLPVPELDVTALRQQFSQILGSISPQEQENVLKHWQMSDDDGKVKFMQYIVNNANAATGYGIQDERLIPQQNLGL